MNKEWPKISVITPTLNQARFIEKTIKSVLEQNYPNLEYLVFDGGSSDGTQEILSRYSDFIKWWSEPDKGQSHAINKGLRMATGEIVAYLNSDDEYEKGALYAVGHFFATHKNAFWVTGKCKIIDESGNPIMFLIEKYKTLLLLSREKLLGIVDYVAQPATFWRRSAIEKVGYFDEGLKYTMDYDYWLRMAKHYKLFFINRYLAKFRIYPTSKTWQSALLQQQEEDLVINRHVSSSAIRLLHSLHRKLNIAGYSVLYKFRERLRY